MTIWDAVRFDDILGCCEAFDEFKMLDNMAYSKNLSTIS